MEREELVKALNASYMEGVQLLADVSMMLLHVQDIDDILELTWERYLIRYDLTQIRFMLTNLDN